ncbi:MAG: NADH-quinone oxidoreductase subunit N, partial [Chloroflexota bacterium]
LAGGLLILILDTSFNDERNSGTGYTAISVLFLIVATAGVLIQSVGMLDGFTRTGAGPTLAMDMISIDLFGTFMKITIYMVMILVAVAGGSYLNRRISGHGEFWTLYLFVTVAMSLASSANNLLLIFLAVEFLSITSYILVGFFREDQRSTEAGVKYFLYGSVASALMLYGMSLLYGASGSLVLGDIALAFEENSGLGIIVMPATIMALVGLGFKTSLAPFFQWAPDTYDGAPTPVTAYLSTASKAVGFAVMARIFIVALGGFRSEWVPILAGLSIFTMTAGNLMALRQSSVKRMLAYSSVAQAGYILMGLVAVVSTTQIGFDDLSLNGLNGLLVYIFAYLFTNVGAFMVVLAVEERAGSTDISAYEGLFHKAPSLALSMLIFLLSLTGIPATGGFMGKFFVFGAAVQHQYFWLAGFAAVNAGIAGFYYLNVARAMFFAGVDEVEQVTEGPDAGTPVRMPVGMAMQIAVTICVIGTFWLGLYPSMILDWAKGASDQLLALMM